MNGHVGLMLEALYEELVGAAIDLPIDVSDFVARQVSAIIAELDALAAHARGVAAGVEALDGAAGREDHTAELVEILHAQVAVVHAAGDGGFSHGVFGTKMGT